MPRQDEVENGEGKSLMLIKYTYCDDALPLSTCCLLQPNTGRAPPNICGTENGQHSKKDENDIFNFVSAIC